MTGRVRYTPEAEQQLNELDEWITDRASAATARRFVLAVITHCDGILTFPNSGRSRDEVRPGMRTTTYKKRTLIAYAVTESDDDVVVDIVGIFHGGQDWEARLSGNTSGAAEA